MLARRSGPVALLVLLALAALGLPVQAAPATDGSRDALVAGQAMAADPTQLVSAELEGDLEAGTATSPLALMTFDDEARNGFPTSGEGFPGLSTGDASFMNDGDQTYFASSGLGAMTTNTGTDLAGLTTEWAIPAGEGQVCFIVDIKFLSEEFPEYVGSSFNDFVVGRINNTDPPTIDVDNTPVAEGNFLRDNEGKAITVNNNYNVTAGKADTTVFDGATPTLQGRSVVPEEESVETFTFSVWMADVGDSIFDSMVFLDNARVERTENCTTGTTGPSKTTVKGNAKGDKVNVFGAVVPSAPGVEMTVTLYKKVNGKFKQIGQKHPVLGEAVDLDGDGILEGSKYKTNFARPDGTDTCKAKARFPGDADHFPSTAQKTFDC